MNYSQNFLFNRAIKKYGWHNIKHDILHEIDEEDRNILVDRLNNLEEFEILSRNTLAPNGYNLNSGGKNKIPSDYTIQKMSESKKEFYAKGGRVWNEGLKFSGMSGKKHSMKTLSKMSNTRKRIISEKLSRNEKVFRSPGEYTHSTKTRKKIGDAQRGKKRPSGKHYYNNGLINVLAIECPDGFVAGRLISNRQRNMYKELSVRFKGRVLTDEWKSKISNTLKKRNRTDLILDKHKNKE